MLGTSTLTQRTKCPIDTQLPEQEESKERKPAWTLAMKLWFLLGLFLILSGFIILGLPFASASEQLVAETVPLVPILYKPSPLSLEPTAKLPREFARGEFEEEYILDSFPYRNESVKEFVSRAKQYQMRPGYIFVQLAHYRDVWCDNTLHEIFSKCRLCDRIVVGLCDQILIPESEYECLDKECRSERSDVPCIGPYERRKQMRVIHLHDHQAKGPTWARFLVSKLWRGEEFFLQVDAHSFFIKDWDIKIVDMLHKMPSRNPVISHYPVSTVSQLSSAGVPWICNATFLDYLNGLFSQTSYWYHPLRWGGKPNKTPFIGAGFFLAYSTWMIDVPYDPYLPFFFHGEEFLIAARLWTRGYDFFVPLQNIISHIYGHR
jgi:hypothetical protein